MPKPPSKKQVESFSHDDAHRKNIPTAEYQSMVQKETSDPLRVAYERRNKDLDPQLVWRGKDLSDWSDLVVSAPPLYIQEKVQPKVLIDDLIRRSEELLVDSGERKRDAQIDLFSDFNGLPSEGAKTEFYQHDAHWTNRMILGDSLYVMASLAEREGLRGQVQCIYLDPPYGIKFNSNFQWSTTSRDVKDGNAEHITREPEQVKAFRDTWRDGIHSYLTYLRDRFTVARELLSDSGSIFVQIGDENVHRVRALMDEVFGEENSISLITFKKTTGAGSPAIGTNVLASTTDYIVWYAKNVNLVKYRQVYISKGFDEGGADQYSYIEFGDGLRRRMTSEERENSKKLPSDVEPFRIGDMTAQTAVVSSTFPVSIFGKTITPKKGGWKTNTMGMRVLHNANRLMVFGETLSYVRYLSDFPVMTINNTWDDTVISGFSDPKVYVVQTAAKVIARCLLMATDPGDLVLDPTCGSGTTAYVAEQWGRRWITIDTSRVSLALARARIMGARFPFYLLADSRDGQAKEAEIAQTVPSSKPVYNKLNQGFVYERVPHITLKSIANNAEIDVIYESWQKKLEPLREKLSEVISEEWIVNRKKDLSANHSPLSTNHSLEEWEIPREADAAWTAEAKKLHAEWWKGRIARQKEIDDSIAAKAEYEFLYDKPYEDKKKVRVSGPFTVESLSPHRVMVMDENDKLLESVKDPAGAYGERDFASMILENLKTAGVQQAHKDDKIVFTSLTPWPGKFVCAEGRYEDKRAGVFIGPEFGTVSRPDLVEAAREAADSGFDVLIACAFNYDAHSTEFDKLGRVPVLKARMNADLHMADDLRNNGKGNLFVIFGEPDIEIQEAPGGQIKVEVKGVDVFHPASGEVRSDGPEGIACWFVDTDYNEESFFVRQAYFLGAGDPYGSLKTTLKAEINAEAWASLNSAVSRPFDKPKSGRIAVKVINHLGDEVMKVYKA